MLSIQFISSLLVSIVLFINAFYSNTVYFKFEIIKSRARIAFAQTNKSDSDKHRQQINLNHTLVAHYNHSPLPMALGIIGIPEIKQEDDNDDDDDILMAPLLSTEQNQYISEINRYINTPINISYCGAPQSSLIKRVFPDRYDSMSVKIVDGEECFLTRYALRPLDPKFTLEANFQKLLIAHVGAVEAQLIWNSVSALIPKTKYNAAGRKQFTYAVLELKVTVQDQVHIPILAKDIKIAMDILDEKLVCHKNDEHSWRMAHFHYFEYIPQTNSNYPHKYTLTGLEISNVVADIHSIQNHIQITKLLILNFRGLAVDNHTWKLKYVNTLPNKGFVTYIIQISSKVPIHEEYEALISHKGKFTVPNFRTGPLLGKQRKITLLVHGWKRKRKVIKSAEQNSTYMKDKFAHLVDAQLCLIPICTEIMDNTVINNSPTRQLTRSALIKIINRKLFLFHRNYSDRSVMYTVEHIIKYGKLNYKWKQEETPEFGVVYRFPTAQSERERRGRRNVSANTFAHITNLSILSGNNLDTLTGPSEIQGIPI